jgi:hypothetical protein
MGIRNHKIRDFVTLIIVWLLRKGSPDEQLAQVVHMDTPGIDTHIYIYIYIYIDVISRFFCAVNSLGDFRCKSHK